MVVARRILSILSHPNALYAFSSCPLNCHPMIGSICSSILFGPAALRISLPPTQVEAHSSERDVQVLGVVLSEQLLPVVEMVVVGQVNLEPKTRKRRHPCCVVKSV